MLKGPPAGLRVYEGNVKTMTQYANELFSWRMQLEQAQKKLPYSMNALAQILARVDQRYSFEKSAGPVDPRQQNASAAWKIPVRRITSHYFQGWYVRRLAPGTWAVYNPTREAYYIEYGIHTSGRRVRRPIRKLSLIATLKFADRHRVGQYVWESIFGHLRNRGVGDKPLVAISNLVPRGAAISNIAVQSPGVMPTL
jgi:hypothetical protein